MKIKGIKGMSIIDIQDEILNGGRFVQFTWCFSIIVMTFRQSSAIYFIRAKESAFVKGLPFTIISFLFGWWGIPWGVIYTSGSLYANIGGGKNMTGEIMKAFYRKTCGHVFEFERAKAVAHS